MIARRTLFAALALAAALPALAQDLSNPTQPQPKLPTEAMVVVTHDNRRLNFEVEMALTQAQQTVGLMFRKTVPEGTGMLFDWGVPRQSQMWMRNTVAPLDMLFIDQAGVIVHIAENTVPYSLAVIDSVKPVRATVEIAAGTAEKLDIRVGDKVEQRLFGTAK